MEVRDDWLFKALTGGTAILAGIAARQGLELLWKALRDRDPPENPSSPLTDWEEALTWGLTVGAAMGAARILGRRLATEGWRRKVGHYPTELLGTR